jgi:hypothetical protein
MVSETNQENDMSKPNVERIDVNSDQALSTWARKFDASAEQIREAVKAVGNHPDDVELHLKGSRSSSNSERVAKQAG